MIVVANKSGQLANRLFLFSHLIAFTIENGGTIINPSFEEYACYFPMTRRDLLCKFPISIVSLPAELPVRQKLFKTVERWRDRISRRKLFSQAISEINISADEVCHMEKPAFRTLVKEKKLVLLIGWNYRDYNALEANAETIRRIFQPTTQIQANILNLINRCRENASILIGVHIRRGDYKEHRDGRFYYSWDQYASAMRRVIQIFGRQKVQFLICSNETIETSYFSEFNYNIGNNHIVEDLYSFAQCDYILGPPSTYTMWASFIGQVPLYKMFSSDVPFSLDDFQYSGGNCDIPEDIERWVEWH